MEVSPDVKVKVQRGPFAVDLEEGKTYHYCVCGRSLRQPFCDGHHAGTAFSPLAFTATATKKHYLCGCKHTKHEPNCDGEHNRLEW